MRKLRISLMIFMSAGFVLGGCKASTGQEIKNEESITEILSESPAGSEQEAISQQTEEMAKEPEQVSEQVIKIINPGVDYYIDSSVKATEFSKMLSLELVEKEHNKITDTKNWLIDNGLSLEQFPYSDDTYTYETKGDNNYETYLLTLSKLESGEKVTLDFSEFQYGESYREEDYDFIKQRINFAKVQDGILYVATSHNTYAESSPQNAYLTAIDLSDYHVIWKTEPLTCNSYSFVIREKVIICGYGFTSEKDYLKLVDCETGLIVNETPIDSMAEYLILKDDKLFVRTYDTNYIFKLTGKE